MSSHIPVITPLSAFTPCQHGLAHNVHNVQHGPGLLEEMEEVNEIGENPKEMTPLHATV